MSESPTRHLCESFPDLSMVSSPSTGSPFSDSPSPQSSMGSERPDDIESIMNCILKLDFVRSEPSYTVPWMMMEQKRSSASAFILSKRRVITNAHCVGDSLRINLRRRDHDVLHRAHVVAVSSECDLALLEIRDDAFWEDFEQLFESKDAFLKPGPMPQIQDRVNAFGYPSNFHHLCVTSGVVSRITMNTNSLHNLAKVSIQIDAAISPGNSGGPVLNDNGEVVGVAFEACPVMGTFAGNKGSVIPYITVNRFLQDIERNTCYTGFPVIGFNWQSMENDHLRNAFRMKKNQRGIRVKSIPKNSDVSRVLRKGDIVTHIDDTAISNQGTVPFRGPERLSVDFIMTEKFTKENVSISYIRDGRLRHGKYWLSSLEDEPVVSPITIIRGVRQRPDYLIYGGLVFQTMTKELSTLMREYISFHRAVRMEDMERTEYIGKQEVDKIVVLVAVLDCNSLVGYEEDLAISVGAAVNIVNGEIVSNLTQMRQLIDDRRTEVPFVRFEFEFGLIVILDRKGVEKEEAEILSANSIASRHHFRIEAQ